MEKALICTVMMNRLDWALTQQAGDGHCLSISRLNFRLPTGVFPFLALRPCHHSVCLKPQTASGRPKDVGGGRVQRQSS